MRAKVIWLRQARRDLVEIIDYISADNPSAADRYRLGVISACRKLVDFPLSGRRYYDRFRTITYRNHLVFYEVASDPTTVTIVMIIDSRRDVESIVPPLI